VHLGSEIDPYIDSDDQRAIEPPNQN
jgi:hypothetical protein